MRAVAPMRSTTVGRFVCRGRIDGLNFNDRARGHGFNNGLRRRSLFWIDSHPFDLTIRFRIRMVTTPLRAVAVPLWTVAAPLGTIARPAGRTTVTIEWHSGGAGDEGCCNDRVTHLNVYLVCRCGRRRFVDRILFLRTFVVNFERFSLIGGNERGAASCKFG